MAPELVAKRDYFPQKVDLWALGVVLYIMLHGYFPFKGGNNIQLYSSIRGGRYIISKSVSDKAK